MRSSYQGVRCVSQGTNGSPSPIRSSRDFYLKPEFERDELEAFLLAHGITPVPFYLGKIEAGEDELRTRYQTIFAKEKRSVAAPTASLHFTERVFETLQEKGIERKEITLDVGLGTFAEVEEHNVINRKLHFERFEIGEETVDALREAKASGKDVIAVGTTVTRTLEASAEFLRSEAKGNYTSSTDLFILPPYDFKMVDHLITNFHVPNSSLMALVDAFLLHKGAKRRILELYKIAADEGFMFYSFGDSMLIL